MAAATTLRTPLRRRVKVIEHGMGTPVVFLHSAQICGLRDWWRAHVRAGPWYEAFEEFVDFYNGPGSFARWPPPRREAFLTVQQARGTYGTFSSTACSHSTRSPG